MSYLLAGRAIAPDVHVVTVGGELDLDAAPELRATIDQALADGFSKLVVDLGDVTFIDSTGIGVLVGALKRLGRAGGRLELVCSEPNLLRIFEITGLDQQLPIHASRDAALAVCVGRS
jgi:anti-sigma B factor antagonist